MMFNRNLLWMILLGVMILEGSLVHWLIPSAWQKQVFVSPNILLIVIMYIGLYRHRHSALVHGIIFGLLHDLLYYGNMIGVYAFGFGLVGYLVGLVSRRKPPLMATSLLLIATGELLFELSNYGLNYLFNITHVDFRYVLTHIVLPSVLFNLLIALLLYIPMRKLFEYIGTVQEDRFH
ncbi:rod shape-determining protein MreD [Paenibacillus larvae]|nr:rod shape-determining protein MreD [Paenibacillus larvae]PCK71322.1 hypothetical protein PL1_0853 [Paenibacillus larvae subsp. larvae B-3650]AQR77604.1 rod shape-determining protein MreD [Paenibacillus larvae subsp. larvae]MCY9571006.1 rod shape-determining protein MreD [Paenibacillus larvae]MDT2193674.1 rod shape-determining protein MreD [Paenibacillus larvae]MDT2238756.1 rod shape-determining protein MreD [Paenibacillus larvae]